MKKNWFTLYGDTFLWINDDSGLVYNAGNNKRFHFHLSDKIVDICHQLIETTNLYSVELTDEAIKDSEINKWINSIESIQAGYRTLDVAFDERPVSLNPILKVQDNKKYYNEQHKLGFNSKKYS